MAKLVFRETVSRIVQTTASCKIYLPCVVNIGNVRTTGPSIDHRINPYFTITAPEYITAFVFSGAPYDTAEYSPIYFDCSASTL